jgi:CBS domain-containing protein
MNVENVMTRAPKTCSTTDTLSRAAQLMWDNDFGSVPVVDGNGRLAGIVTDRDVCMAGYTQGRALHEIPIESVMSRLLYTLAPHDPIQNALTLLQERQIRRVPVVDGRGMLVGILSLADVVCASAEGRIGKHTRPEAVFSAVHAVSKPRKTPATEGKDSTQTAGIKNTVIPAAVPAARAGSPKTPAGNSAGQKGSAPSLAKSSKRK